MKKKNLLTKPVDWEDEFENALREVPPERRVELYNKTSPILKEGMEFKGQVIIIGTNSPIKDNFRDLWENSKED